MLSSCCQFCTLVGLSAFVCISQASLGLVLALCEDVPMAGIGIHFFVQKYAIPTFQVSRL